MITKFNYQGFDVAFENGKRLMVNASEMAKPFCTKPSDWTRTEQAQRMIHALATSHNCELNDLVFVVNGGSNPGTWMHEDVALVFAQWLNPQFYIWCNSKVKEMVKIETAVKLPDFSNPVLAARAWADAMEQKQLSDNKVKELEPKALYHDEVLTSKTAITTTVIAKELGMSAEALNKKLHSLGVQFKVNGTWILYAKYQDKDYTKTKTATFEDSKGNQQSHIQTYWTEKGRNFIHGMVKGSYVYSHS